MVRRGFTLVETLVAAALLLLLGLILSSFLIHSFRIYGRGVRMGQLQQSVLVVMTRVREEVRLARPESLATQGSPPAPILVMASNRPLECDPATGEILWRRWLYFYHVPDAGEVRMHSEEFAPTARPPQTAPNLTPPFDPRDHLVADHIARFEVTVGGPTPQEDGLVRILVEAQDNDLKTVLESRVASLPGVNP